MIIIPLIVMVVLILVFVWIRADTNCHRIDPDSSVSATDTVDQSKNLEKKRESS